MRTHALAWAIAALSAVSSQFSADGRWIPSHHFGNLALIMSGSAEDGNLVPFVLGEMCIVHS